ncbi:MarR family transcriptional regulator [Allosaccharopolyspora coralli]|uniref:MarR family transcriptional regulator n=1 Tax=Allosaccharopolyspora coralli TaxID=2665642 RepID=A0A5Q3QLW5_9PSEU|nr:MarR family transcriptional regulator [Allosaccharopolyspora coralli]
MAERKDSGVSGQDGRRADGTRRTAAAAVERELVLMFRRARNLSTSVATQVHPDLDPTSYSLLLMVDDAGWLRGMDVADRIGLDKSTVSRQIATLVELDLLERVPDPDDGRARRIQLSASGRDRLAAARAKRREYMRGQFASWSTEDMHEFGRLLARFNEMF